MHQPTGAPACRDAESCDDDDDGTNTGGKAEPGRLGITDAGRCQFVWDAEWDGHYCEYCGRPCSL